MNHDAITENEIEEIVGQIVRRRLASPEFADLAMIRAEAEWLGTRINCLHSGSTVEELRSVVSDLSSHQMRAANVFRQAIRRARA